MKISDSKILSTHTGSLPRSPEQQGVLYAEVVGRENVIAGADCGFGTSAWNRKVDTRIAWA